MLKLDLILENMNQIDHYLKEKNKKVIGLMKYELSGRNGIRTHNHLVCKQTLNHSAKLAK